MKQDLRNFRRRNAVVGHGLKYHSDRCLTLTVRYRITAEQNFWPVLTGRHRDRRNFSSLSMGRFGVGILERENSVWAVFREKDAALIGPDSPCILVLQARLSSTIV